MTRPPNNYDIFKLLPSNLNDDLSLLSKNDITDIIRYLNKHYLELRNDLSTNKRLTFGIEFEFEQANRNFISETLLKAGFSKEYKVVMDGSVPSGGEIVTPILNCMEFNWRDLLKISDILNQNARIERNAATHIHIGAQSLNNTKTAILNFALLWATYENIIYRFCFGEYINERPVINFYAKCVAKTFFDDYYILSRIDKLSNLQIIKWLANNDKNTAINLTNVTSLEHEFYGNTIEFRLGMGTFNPIVVQNYINLYIKILNYCNSNKFDEDLIVKRLYLVKDNFSKIETYRKIYINQALEFCDLIFDNNLDKIYFLRQYLKDMLETDRSYLVKAKKFTVI